MLNPSLHFDECLAHVKNGDSLEHVELDLFDLNRQREAILAQEALVKALVLSESPLLARGEDGGVHGSVFFGPHEGSFYFNNWLIPNAKPKQRASMTVNDQFMLTMDTLTRVGYGFFTGYLERNRYASWDIEDQKLSPLYNGRLRAAVEAALLEYTRNSSVHGNSESAHLWISSKGLLVSADQEVFFDIHAEHARRMALEPDLDPLGRQIPRPRYWESYRGPGEQSWKGFVRGNGLADLSTIPDVEVHTEFLPEDEDNDARTRFFMFSRAPFKN